MTGSADRPWVTRELGIELFSTKSSSGYTATQLVQPALRRNPRRAHLLVSTVLGKHISATPAEVMAAGNRLGDLVNEALDGSGQRAIVLGFAETATGLGHCVAARINAQCYLHSTRRQVPHREVHARFEEGHSHATGHMLQPSMVEMLDDGAELVVVDDEFSTGTTAIGAIRALAGRRPRRRHIVASLVDLRTEAHRAAAAAAAIELRTRIDSVSLATGRIVLPEGVVDRVCALPNPKFNPRARRRGDMREVRLPWPASVPDGGRHGFLASDTASFDRAIAVAAAALSDDLDPARPVIVVGHEELMYLPLRLSEAMAKAGLRVRFQTTTRSPAYVLDHPDYPLRRGFRFSAPEEGESEHRYLYNAEWPDGEQNAQIALVVDRPADTPRLRGGGGLVDVLTAAGSDVLIAVTPGADPVQLRAARRNHG